MSKPPADLKEKRAELGGVKNLAKHYKVSPNTITKWLKESGLPTERQPKARKIPADFAEVRATRNFEQLKKHYRVSGAQIRRWTQELGLPAKKMVPPLRQKKPSPSDFRSKAPTMFIAELAAHYNVGKPTISRWIKESGVKTKRFVNYGAPKKPCIPPPKRETRHDLAVEYLRRFTPVSPCDKDGKYKENGDHYRVGNTVMARDEVMEKAESHKQREMNKVFRRRSPVATSIHA